MARLHPSNVKEIASNKPASSATAFNLPDSATAPYRSFDSALATGDTVPVHATNGTDWQDFIGTFTAGTPDTLAQTTLLDSSTGAFIDWSAGGDVTLEVAWLGKQGERIDNPGIVKVTSDGVTTQTITSATFTKIAAALATEVTDDNGWWDGTNKKFLPTTPGQYLIGGGAGVVNLADGKSVIVALYKNGAIVSMLARGYASSAAVVVVLTGASIIEMNGTTDYVELYVWQSDTVSRDTAPEAERMAFWAVRLGD